MPNNLSHLSIESMKDFAKLIRCQDAELIGARLELLTGGFEIFTNLVPECFDLVDLSFQCLDLPSKRQPDPFIRLSIHVILGFEACGLVLHGHPCGGDGSGGTLRLGGYLGDALSRLLEVIQASYERARGIVGCFDKVELPFTRRLYTCD